jgi:vacuolar-type H+-ATPase catalytic subunit A/Vma1
MGEVIRIDADRATIQVYEETGIHHTTGVRWNLAFKTKLL